MDKQQGLKDYSDGKGIMERLFADPIPVGIIRDEPHPWKGQLVEDYRIVQVLKRDGNGNILTYTAVPLAHLPGPMTLEEIQSVFTEFTRPGRWSVYTSQSETPTNVAGGNGE